MDLKLLFMCSTAQFVIAVCAIWKYVLRQVTLRNLCVIGFLFRGNCTCRTVYCNRVVEADKFLFPFLVEFCLISTCLFYVTWKKVGKKAKQIRCIFKPCYKFFQAYKGIEISLFEDGLELLWLFEKMRAVTFSRDCCEALAAFFYNSLGFSMIFLGKL